jgi:hypothetical protein
LGLSIAREIVVAHGGRIGVRSHRGKGSEFYFVLPNAAESMTDEPSEPASDELKKIIRGKPSSELIG